MKGVVVVVANVETELTLRVLLSCRDLYDLIFASV